MNQWVGWITVGFSIGVVVFLFIIAPVSYRLHRQYRLWPGWTMAERIKRLLTLRFGYSYEPEDPATRGKGCIQGIFGARVFFIRHYEEEVVLGLEGGDPVGIPFQRYLHIMVRAARPYLEVRGPLANIKNTDVVLSSYPTGGNDGNSV